MKALKSVFIALVVVTTLTFLGCHDESNSISEDVQHNASTTNNETKIREETTDLNEIFIGNFDATKEVYLISDSISGSDTNNFKCSVRVVGTFDKSSEVIWHYEFYKVNGEQHCTLIMNTGYRHSSPVFDGQPTSKVAINILRYVENNY